MNKLNMGYLGDGVYAGHDGYQVWLSVGLHEQPEVVALDPDTIRSLVQYAVHHGLIKATKIKEAIDIL